MFAELMRNGMSVAKFTQSVIRNLPLNPGQLKRQFLQLQSRKRSSNSTTDCPPPPTECACARAPPLYNTPHPPKDPPENFTPTVVHQAFEGPDGLPYAVFRPFETPCDVLGPGAHKCGEYKNCEYYAYHRYSFAEMQRSTLAIRQEGIRNDGARLLYDYDSGNEDEAHKRGGGDGGSSSGSSSCSSDDSDGDRDGGK